MVSTMEVSSKIKTEATRLSDFVEFNKENGERKSNDKILLAKDIGTDYNFKQELVWKNIFLISLLHLFAFHGIFLILTGNISWKTFLYGVFIMWLTAKGVIIGAHRLYAHKCFKAHPVLRALLLMLHTQAGQNCLYVWVRDHRLHHRYSDSDADPHNSNRGFFFAHMGWLMCKKHPLVKELGKTTDMSDLEEDWMVVFQKKYYFLLYPIFAVLIPMGIPVYFFGEDIFTAFCVSYCLQYVYTLHATWTVNSIAHLYGTRPYDKELNPAESSFVSFITSGEGWHNYHHTYPWDYKAAELPTLYNGSAKCIQWLERIGLVWDLKYVSEETLEKRIKSTGDGTHYKYGNDEARASVTAIGPVHPLNPTYNTTFKAVQQAEYLYYSAEIKGR